MVNERYRVSVRTTKRCSISQVSPRRCTILKLNAQNTYEPLQLEVNVTFNGEPACGEIPDPQRDTSGFERV